MAAGPFLLLPLLLLPGSAARPAAPRAPRHSDGTFTSELSRLRERAQLQRLLQGLVGKRRANYDLGFGGSDQDTENSTAWTESAQGRSCLLWSEMPAPQAWIPLRDHLQQAWSPPLPPRLSSGAMVSEPASPAAGTQMKP